MLVCFVFGLSSLLLPPLLLSPFCFFVRIWFFQSSKIYWPLPAWARSHNARIRRYTSRLESCFVVAVEINAIVVMESETDPRIEVIAPDDTHGKQVKGGCYQRCHWNLPQNYAGVENGVVKVNAHSDGARGNG